MSEITECVLCGGTVAPDGYCWDCGGAQPSFRLLLCTDGLWRYLPGAAALRDVLGRRPAGGGVLEEARSLVGYALEAGGHDNVTVVLVPVVPGPPGVPVAGA